MSARATLGLLAVAAGLCACETRSAPVAAAAGAIPANAFFVGPQPGPDRRFTPVVNPYTGSREALAEGRRLFNWYNCSGCHGDHGGGGMGPSLRDSVWRYGGTDAEVFASITQGRQFGMPAWGSKLPQDQIWRLVTYIKSLRTPDEPDPPR